ncbi:hypothetical protein C241_15638 [Bradyrhizobium lupini HPC(L)]|uniref:Uncharacterized protein n=1 Tax=Bradyrhizobium lupini HPC(L) TaxID=1229491 RepID=A0ABN0HJD2_RHILU|nr:hypothetical protein C241_15638 [Bradyrhizobium lupini HPC(L)]
MNEPIRFLLEDADLQALLQNRRDHAGFFMGLNSAKLAKVPLLRWNRRATFVLASSHGDPVTVTASERGNGNKDDKMVLVVRGGMRPTCLEIRPP